jgi:hypothetical protein
MLDDSLEEDARTGEDSAPNPMSPLAAPLAIDPTLTPPWEKCVANACFLLPEDMAIFLDEPARRDALENLSFAPSPNGTSLIGSHAPLILLEASGTPRQLVSPGSAHRNDGPLAQRRTWFTWGTA